MNKDFLYFSVRTSVSPSNEKLIPEKETACGFFFVFVCFTTLDGSQRRSSWVDARGAALPAGGAGAGSVPPACGVLTGAGKPEPLIP